MFRTLLGIGLFTAIAFASPAGGGPTAGPGHDDVRPKGQYEVTVTPEMRQHSRILDTLYFAGTAYGLVVLFVILATGLSRRMAATSAEIARKPFLTAMLFFIFFSTVTTLFDLPLSYYAGWIVPHQFGLSDQSRLSWLDDLAKEFAFNALIGSFLAALALLAIRRFKRWWLPLWLGTIPVMLIGALLIPLVFDPMFNKFEPLKDQTLKQALLDEASRAGITGGRVFQVDKSKQTKEMNAYVTGIGPTNRIVMWDTLLAKMDRDEILAVMGHEMGHYVLGHIWQGLGWGALISLLVCFLAQQSYERGLARWGGRWGIESKGDPAALPWLLVIVSIIGFALSPLINGLSRHTEHEADVFSLELTHLNDPLARSFVKFAHDSKVDPEPAPFIEFWRYSHPSLKRRIDFVRTYKPWERGEPNSVWKGK